MENLNLIERREKLMYNLAGFTLGGVYNYFEKIEQPLFEDIELFEGGTVYADTTWENPQEIPAIDKDVMIDYIMELGCDLQVWRQNPNRFKLMTERFFKANYNNFRMMWIALNMDYNPIDNYDKHEYIIDEYDSLHRRTDTTHYKDTNDLDIVGKEKTTETPTGSETTTNKYDNHQITENTISADNSSGYQEDNKSDVTMADTTTKLSFTENRKTVSELEYNNRANNGTFEHTYLDGNDLNEHQGDDTHKSWIHGNAGTTMTADIIAKELEMRQFDFYDYVAKLYSKRLLMEVY